MTSESSPESPHAEVLRLRQELAALTTVSEDQARAQGAIPLTSVYPTRIIANVAMLLRAIDQDRGRPSVLVKTKNGIAIWRAPR